MRSPSLPASGPGAILPSSSTSARGWRRHLISRPLSTLQPGWWARIVTSTPDEPRPDVRVRQHVAPHARSALGWLRIGLRVLVSGFDEDDRETTLRWLDSGQYEARLLLESGMAIDRSARAGEVTIGWSVVPVLLLPRVPLRPGPAPCVEPHWCTCVAPDHICDGEHE